MSYTPLFIFLLVLAVSYADYENVTINDSFNENIVRIRECISDAGFDPLPLPNLATTLNVKFIFVNVPVTLNLTNGLLAGGSTIKILDDSYLTFNASTISLHGRIHFDKLKAKFNFFYDTGFYSDKGLLDATVKNFTVAINADFKLSELLVENPKIKLDYGDLSFKMISHALFSPMTNVIANVAASRYKAEVLKLSEGITVGTANQVIKRVNKLLSKLPKIEVTNFIQDLRSGRLAQVLVDNCNAKNITEPIQEQATILINL